MSNAARIPIRLTRGLYLLAVLAILSGLNSCTHSVREKPAQPQAETRAVWVSVLGEGFKSPEEIEQLVESARRANLNTIIAQVRRRGAVYFQSEIEPRGVPIQDRPDFDPLATLLEKAHDTSGGKARLDVHAWFNVFPIGSQEDLLSASPAPISVAHPDWFTRDATGEVGTDLDPAVPAVQDHIIRLIEECLSHYDVDGVNLDFVRYSGKDKGYHPLALERFHRLTGRSDLPSVDDAQWSQFRRDQVTAFVRRCAVSVWSHRPQAQFTVDAVGFGRPPLRDFSDTSPYFQVFQDWAGWVKKGYVDTVCRMGYKREHVPQQAEHFRGWADFTKQLEQECSGRRLTLGIGGYFNSPEGALAQYQEALGRGLGTSLFSYYRPTRDDSAQGQYGYRSSFWDALGREIYTRPVEPPRPDWRMERAVIAGFLKDGSGKPVDDGEVLLLGTEHWARTDGSGFFAFVDLEPGSYRLHAPGSLPGEKMVEAQVGAVTWIR